MNLTQITIPTAYNKVVINYREDNDNDFAIIREIFNRNIYDFDMGKITENVVLDVGANIGIFTLYVLAAAHNNSQPVHIYAVEPELNNLEILRKNIAENEALFEHGAQVSIVEMAVSDYNGVSYITDEGGESQLSDKGQKVTVITYDELVKKIDKIDFTKIDIEQSEVPTLQAASRNSILKSHYYAVEFDESNHKDQFLDIVKPFISDFSISTFGVPKNGCNIYMENHSW
jgi:FkbM family methyltransferase